MKRGILLLCVIVGVVAFRRHRGWHRDSYTEFQQADAYSTENPATTWPYDVAEGGTQPTTKLRLFEDFTLSTPSMRNAIINNVPVTPVFHYMGNASDANQWVGEIGETLAIGGTGTTPTIPWHAPTLNQETATAMMQGQIFQAPTSATGDIAGQDIMLELLLRSPVSTGAGLNRHELSKHANAIAAANDGWSVYFDNNTWNFVMSDGVDQAVLSSGTTNNVSWQYVVIFVDRSEASTNGAQMYVNCTASAGVDFSAVGADVSTTKELTFGNDSDDAGTTKGDAIWLVASMYLQDSWWPGGASNPTLWQSICNDRFAAYIGTKAQEAAGSRVPTSQIRSTVAWVDTQDTVTNIRYLHHMGTAWTRFVLREGVSGIPHRGMQSVKTHTNSVIRSRQFDTGWTLANTVITANFILDPTQELTAERFRSTNGIGSSVIHSARQQVTSFGGTEQRAVMSVWAKHGEKDWVFMDVKRTGPVSETAAIEGFFNVNTCAIGSVGTSCGSGDCVHRLVAENWGDLNGDGEDWCRLIMVFQTADPNTFFPSIGPAGSNGTKAYEADPFIPGAPVAAAYFMGAYFTDDEQDYAHSYIDTTSATATNNADDLRYSTAGNVPSTGRGAMRIDTAARNIDYSSTTNDPVFMSISDGTVAELVIANQSSATDNAECGVRDGGVQQADVAGTDVSTNAQHQMVCQWQTNDVRIYVNHVAGGTDTVATMPTMNDIQIGASPLNTGQEGQVITYVELWDEFSYPP